MPLSVLLSVSPILLSDLYQCILQVCYYLFDLYHCLTCTIAFCTNTAVWLVPMYLTSVLLFVWPVPLFDLYHCLTCTTVWPVCYYFRIITCTWAPIPLWASWTWWSATSTPRLTTVCLTCTTVWPVPLFDLYHCLTRMLLFQNNHLYLGTDSSVSQLNVVVCYQYTKVDHCLFDPYCGWDRYAELCRSIQFNKG